MARALVACGDSPRGDPEHPPGGDAELPAGAIKFTMAEKMAVEAGGTKRKNEMDGESEAASPGRRSPGQVTMEAITAVLASQTREIQDGTSRQIAAALKDFEEKTVKRMEQSEDRVLQIARNQDAKIEGLLDRVKKLEEKPPVASAGSTAEGGERLALVMGGWKRDTHRDDILQDFAAMVKDLDLGESLDDEYFVPGIRSSVVIAPFIQRPSETEALTRKRMDKVMHLVREAKMQTQHLPDNTSIWAAVSRPKAVRRMAAHAGKVRRCLYLLDMNAKKSECEYSSGTVWMGGALLASATRCKPNQDGILEGVTPGSWLDAVAVAHVVPCEVKRVVDAWKQCLEG